MEDKQIYDIAQRLGFNTHKNKGELKRKGLVGAGIKTWEELKSQYELIQTTRETKNVFHHIQAVKQYEELLDKLFGNEKNNFFK